MCKVNEAGIKALADVMERIIRGEFETKKEQPKGLTDEEILEQLKQFYGPRVVVRDSNKLDLMQAAAAKLDEISDALDDIYEYIRRMQ